MTPPEIKLGDSHGSSDSLYSSSTVSFPSGILTPSTPASSSATSGVRSPDRSNGRTKAIQEVAVIDETSADGTDPEVSRFTVQFNQLATTIGKGQDQGHKLLEDIARVREERVLSIAEFDAMTERTHQMFSARELAFVEQDSIEPIASDTVATTKTTAQSSDSELQEQLAALCQENNELKAQLQTLEITAQEQRGHVAIEDSSSGQTEVITSRQQEGLATVWSQLNRPAREQRLRASVRESYGGWSEAIEEKLIEPLLDSGMSFQKCHACLEEIINVNKGKPVKDRAGRAVFFAKYPGMKLALANGARKA
ncbi:hypothetical protein LTR56_011619 [Elasticomyces elasticus]|nr:hypothetical protein LTR22_026870 [Elasticomyces elasticus]KAK3640969.1 hypothetical protein LTR56_011619 [Elasticomyces elasticus]KAK5748162.1 hypothetical protein LTS12_021811 [Elasticomyces elasticus]